METDILREQDLRVYTIWRAEISHFKTQHMSYKKTGTEVSELGETLRAWTKASFSGKFWEN